MNRDAAIAHRRALQEIHRRALSNFTYKHDKDVHGISEHWAYPGEFWEAGHKFVGDCDDFAMYCRALCREQNIPNRLVICLTETGEGHLVMESNGWILDNRQTRLMGSKTLEKLGYQWLYISGYNAGDPWYKVTLAR